MKKVLALALVFGLLFTLSACVGAPDGKPTVTTTTTTTTTAPTTTTTTAEETLNTSVITDPAGITTTVPTTQFTKETIIITTTTKTTRTHMQIPEYVSERGALIMALEHAELTEADVQNVEVEYDLRHGYQVWEVSFMHQEFEYAYVIDAASHTITSFVKNDVIRSTGIGGASATSPKFGITTEVALATALKHAGIPEYQAYNVEVEIDTEDGVYEVTFEAGGYEYEYEVDAKTGMVVRHEKEKWD